MNEYILTDSHSSRHIHGGAPHHAFKRLGIPAQKVIDFSVNVSPLGPPGIIFQNWNRLSENIRSYPTINGDGIAEYFMERFGLERDNILPGNGSTECIYLVPRALGIKKVCLITPSFHDYERSCLLAGCEIEDYQLSAAHDFSEPSFTSLEKAFKEVDALVLGNPNNPTGTLFSTRKILGLAERFPDKWILVDEAFIQFLDDYRERTLADPRHIRQNILVFHSLTKIYDLPGIRLGCVIGHTDTIKLLRDHKEPWTVNGIAERVAQLLTNSGDYEQRLRSILHQERQRFIESLGQLEGIKLFPTAVNYMLARWTATDNLDDLLRFLLANGCHVRDCRNFRHLKKNFFRFAILTSTENTRLIDLIGSCQAENTA